MAKSVQELNQKLASTIVGRTLSDFGQRIFFPQGILAQASQAQQSTKAFNATIGMALQNGQPLILPEMRQNLPYLSPQETVSYAPPAGELQLRTLWKQELLRKNPDLSSTFSLPIVVPGITAALSLAADLFIDQNDAIVLPELCWDNYPLIFQTKNQAQCETFPLFQEDKLDIEGLLETIKKKANRGKVILVLNFPHNPTGYSPTYNEAKALTQGLIHLAEQGLDLVVIIDDAYFGLYYEENTYKQSFFSVLSCAHERILAIKADGATKEAFSWGLRIAFLTFGSFGLSQQHYEALEQKVLGAIRVFYSSSSRLGQSLLSKELLSLTHQTAKEQYHRVLQERYQTVKNILSTRTKGKALKPLPFNSGYFMSFELIQGEAETLRQYLLTKHSIGTIAFNKKFLRIAYSSIENDHLDALYDTIFEASDQLF